MSALFHIASSKEPPVIPEVLSKEGRDFLLQCFNRRAARQACTLLIAAQNCMLRLAARRLTRNGRAGLGWMRGPGLRAGDRRRMLCWGSPPRVPCVGLRGEFCAFTAESAQGHPRRNPKERPSASRLLRHAWLADLVPQGMAAPLTNLSVATHLPPGRVRTPRRVLASQSPCLCIKESAISTQANALLPGLSFYGPPM